MRYEFSEYFDVNKEDKPYDSRQEELKDYISLVDIMLENFMDVIMEHEEGLVFHKSIPMTPEQIEIIYEQEPAERGIDRLDEETISAALRGLSYIENRSKASAGYVFLPVFDLINRFNLSDFEKFCLLFSIATEENLTYGRLLGFMAQNKSGHLATYGTVLVLYEALYGPDSLQAYDEKKMDTFFFCPDDKDSVPGMRYYRTLQLKGVVRDYVFSDERKPDERYLYIDGDIEASFFEEEVEKLCRIKSDEPLQIYIEASDSQDVLHSLSVVADKKGLPLYLVDDADSVFDCEEKLLTAALYPGLLALYVNPKRQREEIKTLLKKVRTFLPEQEIYLYGDEKMPEKELPKEYAPLVFSLKRPDSMTRLKIWEYYIAQNGLSLCDDISLEDLSECYNFSFGMIKSVLRRASLQIKATDASSSKILTKDILLPVIFRINEANFGSLATYIPAAYTWDDIEMDDRERSVLKTACNRYRLRGRLDRANGISGNNAYGNGVSLLLYGPPGTGKTMAARVISSELSLPLYRVDVSQIFSKYIGETEKNLSVIFEEASKSNVILFFDEADALFTKRTDVTDSNDKHANAQTAFLLQKIEEFTGMTLLATNLYHNFDTAFVRRITYVARLDAPDVETRKRLWKNSLPESVPMEDNIDFDFLAERFELSGANIKAIMLSAAYMAGAEGAKVSAAYIVKAMRYEFVKLGRIIDPTEFGKYVMYV